MPIPIPGPATRRLALPTLSLGRVYFMLVIGLGVAVAAWILSASGGSTWYLANITFWAMAVLGVVTELIAIPLPKGGRLTASFAVIFASLLLLGLPAAVVLVGLVCAVVGGLIQRRAVSLNLFNFAQYTLSYGAAHWVLALCGYGSHATIHGADFPFMLLATGAYQAVNVALVNGVITLEKRIAPWKILVEDDRWEIGFTFVLAPLAVLLVVLHHTYGWWGLVTALVPLLFCASMLVLYLQVKRSREDLAMAHRELSVLHQVALKIGSQIHLETTLALIAQEVGHMVPYDECLIFLLQEDPQTGQARLVRQRIDDERTCARPLDLEPGQGVIGSVASRNEAVLLDDLAPVDDKLAFLEAYASLLAVPIVAEDKVLGVISLLHRQARAFNKSDQRLLTILASQAAAAIKNAQLYQATQQLAITDGLTGVYNRRYFQRQLESELRRAPRFGFPIALILMDVDHFKKFNDSHGHLLGDQVLRSVAQILRESVRETDLVARYGGEEFAVILPETTAEQALEVAERIRKRMHAHTFWGRGQTPVKVTLSMGIASNPEADMPADALIELADRCLYQAKNNGRDRIVCATNRADQPLVVKEAKEETPGARQIARRAMAIDASAWRGELLARVARILDLRWQGLAERPFLETDDRVQWGAIAETTVGVLCDQLAGGASDAVPDPTPLDSLPAHPLYAKVREAVVALIQRGVTLTQSEDLVLTVSAVLDAAVTEAPFSPQERLMVLAVAERLTHQLQLCVSHVWHEFYTQTNAQLVQMHELDSRLASVEGLPRTAFEASAFACRILGADAAAVLVRTADGQSLRVLSSWGVVPSQEGVQWLIPTDTGWPAEALDPSRPEGGPLELGSEDPPFSRFVGNAMHSALTVPLVLRGESLGVLALFSADEGRFQATTGSFSRLCRGIAQRLVHALSRGRAEEDQQQRYLEAVLALAETVEAKAAGGRGSLVVRYALGVADVLDVPPSQRDVLRQAALLYDIGNVAVPEAILGKPGDLTPQEARVVRTHPEVGARLLGPVEALRSVVPVIRHHHERWDGGGYPDGLAGEQIPLLARILAVADAFVAMTLDRPYRSALGRDDALAELERTGHYDPKLVSILARLVIAEAAEGATTFDRA